MAAFIVVFSFVGILVWPILIYNRLIRLKNNVEAAWSQIDVQLKRRHDLIPNLVSAVRGYMDFEKTTLERVTAARARAVAASGVREKSFAENTLTDMLGRLMVVVESYPDLKSNENVLKLQEELTTTENRIAFARQFYNDVVTNFNTRLEVFPDVTIASLFSFSPFDFFSAHVSDRAVPSAELSQGK